MRSRLFLTTISFALAWLAVSANAAFAERLPIKTYTVADGLASNRVTSIMHDSRGFLWFCTTEGLSRFDGFSFVTYNTDNGLPFPVINDMLETHSGKYWLATNGAGVIRFNPKGTLSNSDEQAQFIVYPVGDKPVTARVNTLFEDQAGRIWAGTDGGLFVMAANQGEENFRRVPLNLSTYPDEAVQIWTFVEEMDGSLWIGTKYGLLRRFPDGRIIHYAVQPAVGKDVVFALLKDRQHQLWIGSQGGLIVLQPSQLRQTGLAQQDLFLSPQFLIPNPQLAGAIRRFTGRDGLNGNSVNSLCQATDDSIWIGTSDGGLTQFKNGHLQSYDTTKGSLEKVVLYNQQTITEDQEGSLWASITDGGVMRIYKNGFILYDEADSLGRFIYSINESDAHELYVTSGNYLISQFDGKRFTTIRLSIPKQLLNWRPYHNTLQDHSGQWWFATRAGLYRFPKVRIPALATTRPQAVYTVKDGLAGNDITALFEDQRGDVWIGNFAPGSESLTRWERATQTFHRYSAEDGLPPFDAAVSFGEDRDGNLWVGFFSGELARFRDGRFTRISTNATIGVMDIHLDRNGRLWVIARPVGLIRIDEPTAEQPQLISYTSADGLSSNSAIQILEDEQGRIYLSSDSAIDQLDPLTSQIKRYSIVEGLNLARLTCAFRDQQGVLWLGSNTGLVRFTPGVERLAQPPTVFINSLRIAGEPRLASDLGEREINGLVLDANQHQVQIDFFGLSFVGGGVVRYQYKLEGLDENWSMPTTNRTMTYASLSPGAYRFLVRALAADGTESSAPASVSFKILPPFYRRWWFITLAALLVSFTGFAFARSRLQHLRLLRESEHRFRTLAETAADAIITIDEEGKIVYVNAVTEKMFGHSIATIQGKDLTMLMPEAYRHLHQAGFRHYQETGKRHISWEGVELPGLHKDGRELPLEISFGEFIKDGKRFFTGIARDISERKRAEEERRQAQEALQRSRQERYAELEKVRRRIATDLHDDIGSSLTRISLLSEVAQRKVERVTTPIGDALASIAQLSRELVDAMSDIVWAINPQKDTLNDLTQRMRHFASDLFTARQIQFQLRLPAMQQSIRVGANLRRELFLLYKEGINNIVKHSCCTAAEIDFRANEETLFLQLSDNGCGFDVAQQSDGHGLMSMSERTTALGGAFHITSNPSEGTTLQFKIPLRQYEERAKD